jgi:TolB-like protein
VKIRALALVAVLSAGCELVHGEVRGVATEQFPVSWSGDKLEGSAVAQTQTPAAQLAWATTKPAVQSGPAPSGARALSGSLVAVLDFRSVLKGADLMTVDPGYFSNSVRSAIKRLAPATRVMTRENVLVLLRSSGKKLEECEGECEVDTGRRLGADLIVSGDLLRVGSRLKLEMRLHDTRDGQLIDGETVSGRDVDELDAALESTVALLLKTILKQP